MYSCIDFVLFALRTIDVLDGATVTVQARREGIERYEQMETERITNIATEALCHARNLQTKLEERTEFALEIDLHATRTGEEADEMGRRNHQLEEELRTKESLLMSTSDRLAKTNEIMYGIEQRLAMQRIDQVTVVEFGRERDLDNNTRILNTETTKKTSEIRKKSEKNQKKIKKKRNKKR